MHPSDKRASFQVSYLSQTSFVKKRAGDLVAPCILGAAGNSAIVGEALKPILGTG